MAGSGPAFIGDAGAAGPKWGRSEPVDLDTRQALPGRSGPGQTKHGLGGAVKIPPLWSFVHTENRNETVESNFVLILEGKVNQTIII